jgi:hypothetical protein
MTRMRVALCGLGFLLLLLTAGCATTGGSEYASAPYPTYVDQSIFYAQLDPYGSWLEVPPFGLCWVPDDVPWGWRPYSYGYWAYTDFGWTWMSDEPWGWATYHYGRWLDDPGYGWVWVPGNEWAPAWVAWRTSDEWVGWAALPPEASWSPTGLSGYQESSIPTDQWCFVRGQKMLNTDLRTTLAPSVRNEMLLQRTRDITRFEIRAGRPVNQGVELVTVEKLAGRRPPQLTIVDASQPEHGRAQDVQGETVRMFRNTLRPMPANTNVQSAPHPAPRPPAAAPKPIATTQALEQQRQTQARQAQAALERERLELDREQSEELKKASSAAEQQAILQRHAAERQAFEQRRERENQRLQAQLKRRFAKAGGDTTQVHRAPAKTVNVKDPGGKS